MSILSSVDDLDWALEWSRGENEQLRQGCRFWQEANRYQRMRICADAQKAIALGIGWDAYLADLNQFDSAREFVEHLFMDE